MLCVLYHHMKLLWLRYALVIEENNWIHLVFLTFNISFQTFHRITTCPTLTWYMTTFCTTSHQLLHLTHDNHDFYIKYVLKTSHSSFKKKIWCKESCCEKKNREIWSKMSFSWVTGIHYKFKWNMNINMKFKSRFCSKHIQEKCWMWIFHQLPLIPLRISPENILLQQRSQKTNGC